MGGQATVGTVERDEAVDARIGTLFSDLRADVAFHAVDLAGTAEVSIGADRLMPIASIFKLPVLLALAVEGASGRLDLEERVTVTPDERVPGSTGLSVLQDTVEMSLRDLAVLMMSVSDNTATDVVVDRVGLETVNRLLVGLGLQETCIRHDCGAILSSILDEVGPEWARRLIEGETAFEDIDSDILGTLSTNDARRTNCSTPRELTRLLRHVWCDDLEPSAACEQVRHVLGLQVWPHRLASGATPGARFAGKTGTLPGLRHEAGVFTLPDGSAYAVACLTQADDFADHRPDIDSAIGAAGRIAVEWLDSP